MNNALKFPELITDFINMCDLLPLWSSITKSFFPLSPELGFSASVESNFNDQKHRIFSEPLPLGVEDF